MLGWLLESTGSQNLGNSFFVSYTSPEGRTTQGIWDTPLSGLHYQQVFERLNPKNYHDGTKPIKINFENAGQIEIKLYHRESGTKIYNLFLVKK